MWLTGLAPRHVGSSQTRARTRVPCIGRQILNHCATREAPRPPFDSDFKANNVILLLHTSVNISKRWMFSYISGMPLPYLMKLTVIPWYHQIPRSCKNSPICLTSLTPFTISLFDSESTYCIWFLCFLKTLCFRADPFSLCEETESTASHYSAECRHSKFAYLLPVESLICSCILYISCRVEVTSRS